MLQCWTLHPPLFSFANFKLNLIKFFRMIGLTMLWLTLHFYKSFNRYSSRQSCCNVFYLPQVGWRQSCGLPRGWRSLKHSKKVSRLPLQDMSHEPLCFPETVLGGCEEIYRENRSCAASSSPCKLPSKGFLISTDHYDYKFFCHDQHLSQLSSDNSNNLN